MLVSYSADSGRSCGTDFSYYMRGGVGSRRATGPHVLGHESSGIVYAVGLEVTNVRPGDRVALEPALPCYTCRYCRDGQFKWVVTIPGRDSWQLLCPRRILCHSAYWSVRTVSFNPADSIDGTLCQWFKCPAVNAVRLPEKITWPEAGCIQPLAIAVQIARRARTLTHKVVAVFGCGPLGLLCCAVARAYGARHVIAFDISAPRVEFAKKYAAQSGFVTASPPPEADVMTWNDSKAATYLRELNEPAIDVILECSGAESAMQLGISLLRPGGTCEYKLNSYWGGVVDLPSSRGSRHGQAHDFVPVSRAVGKGARSPRFSPVHDGLFRGRY